MNVESGRSSKVRVWTFNSQALGFDDRNGEYESRVRSGGTAGGSISRHACGRSCRRTVVVFRHGTAPNNRETQLVESRKEFIRKLIASARRGSGMLKNHGETRSETSIGRVGREIKLVPRRRSTFQLSPWNIGGWVSFQSRLGRRRRGQPKEGATVCWIEADDKSGDDNKGRAGAVRTSGARG